MKLKISLLLLILFNLSILYGQTGNTLSNPIDAGTFSPSFQYSNIQNTGNFTNEFNGRPSNDVYYKFTLNKKMEVTLKHCGSTLSDTYIHLLNASGEVIAYNDDYSGEGQCSSRMHSYLKKELDAGTYYVVSEGWNANGIILTIISGTVIPMRGDKFNDPIVAGTFNGDFQYSDTQNTVNYTNQHTVRTPNDIFYKFVLNRKTLVTMTHCGSSIDTYMFLLDASGNTLASNDDYSGEGSCSSSSLHSFIQRTLNPGTYYVVSEGYNTSGLITTNITGYTSEEFDYPDIPNSYTPESEAVGSIEGIFNVSPTGAATYAIPIEVPQGVAGLQPSLAIEYNSQQGNGIAGWGCSVAGISAITRGPKDIYHDGTAKGIAYLGYDAFFLDGQRLIRATGTEGQEGAVYYKESDPFTKIIVHGTYNASAANTWFEVQASNGMKYYYGNTASGRQSYTSGSSPRINAWYLDYVEDPFGNYMTYTYYNWSYFMYPNTITYGNNKNESTGLANTVTFSYDYRNDAAPFVIEGNKGSMSYRISTIISKTGSNTYRRYELKYDTTSDGTETKFSRLTNVTVKNAAGDALKPIKLDWNFLSSFGMYNQQPTVNSPSTYPSMNFSNQAYAAADFNGDGLTDIVGIEPVQIPTGPNSWRYDTYAYVYYASLNSYGEPQFISGKNYSLGASFQMADWKEQREGSSAIDFDGDGINEFVVPHVSINEYWKQIGFYIYSNTLNSVFGYNLKNSSEMALYTTGDVNKDGKGDVIYMEKGHSNNKYPGEIVGLNFGTTLYRAAFNLTLPSKPKIMFASDFNGDGLEDIIVFYDGGYTIFWNQGNGISTSTFTDSKKTTGTNIYYMWMIRPGDFNGDGLTDFIMNYTNDSNWYLAINNGNGTFTKNIACTLNVYDQNFTDRDDDNFDVYVGDFDGDGKSDVVINKAMFRKRSDITGSWGEFTKTYAYWMRSTGTSLIQVSAATSVREDDSFSNRHFTGDFNGDGVVDFMNYGYNCYSSSDANVSPVWRLYQSSNSNTSRGKIYYITDGYGGSTSITYASLANGGIYTKGTGSVYPVADYTVPIHAVKTVSMNNGTAGTITTNYGYSGLKAHLQGKGLLGMSSQKVNNSTFGIVTELGVKSWNTTFYIPSATYSKTTVDGKTGETNVTLTIVEKGFPKYFAYPSTKTEKDLDGNTVTTTYKFNTAYGYQEEQKADFGSNMYKTVQYGNYILAGGSYKPQLITRTQKHTDDASAFTQKTAVTYDTSKGYTTQIIENQGSTLALTTDLTYDATGNVLTSVENGSDITPVTNIRTYDASRRFVVKTSTSPATTVMTYTYDTWGKVLTEKDETLASNILTTTHTYDNWGALASTVFSDDRKTSVKKGWNNGTGKRYFILTQGTGEPWVKTWYDNKGREVAVESVGNKSMSIRKTTGYDGKGQVTQMEVQTGSLTTTESYTYDGRGRVTNVRSSTGQTTAYTYGNRAVTTTTNGKAHTKTFDAWGGVKSVTDPVAEITYTYKSLGKPQNITTAGAAFSMTYDDAGNQTKLVDPNAGTLTYTYDAAGRLTKQVDGRGKITTNSYDALGRLSTTVMDGNTTAYTYGTSGYDMLLLTKVQAGSNYSAYTHDRYGRTLTETRQVEGSGLLEFTYTYNTKGELSGITYPGSLQVTRQYDAYGNMEKVLAGTQAIWELTGATGTVYTTLRGGTLTATETRNGQGLLTNLKTVTGSTVLHNMDFVFDGATGNLTSRTGMAAQAESFEYDNTDRLTAVQQGSTPIMNMNYSPNGNILSKTGIGQYGYGSRPHAVSSVENAEGLTSSGNQNITYTAFNKVAHIGERIDTDSLELAFTYGPDRQRWKSVLKKNGNDVKTTIFAGDYEQITESEQPRQLYYINGADGLAAVYVKQSGQADKIYYVHSDHLGSIVKLTDGNGAEVFNASYDAWGKRTVTNNAFAFHRGYTGHEHLDEFALIDMNGRMYDPLLGRFLSPDPFVQMPDFSQNFNRYAYCLNNPLVYTDPSGENPIIIAAIIIGAAAGGYTGYKIAEAKGYDVGNWQTWGYMLGGAVIGAGSAYLGIGVATGGGFMANTMGVLTASYMNSMGMTALSGGMIQPSISFGVASYNFGTGEWGYIGKKGNKWYENVGYGFGALANLTDIVSLFGGGINVDLTAEKKDAISHSALVNESNGINISVGPYRELGEGIDMSALKSVKGIFKELSRTMKGRIWDNHATDGLGWKVSINNVNKNILSKLSESLQLKMDNQTLMWNLLGKSCVGYTAKALWSVGVPNLGGIHPYWLQLQMITRQIGIYSSPYFYQIP
jgi:RHS repeat-associated protein